MCKIVSITITSNRASIIVDALLSVKPFVDAAIIVDVGVTDNSIEDDIAYNYSLKHKEARGMRLE